MVTRDPTPTTPRYGDTRTLRVNRGRGLGRYSQIISGAYSNKSVTRAALAQLLGTAPLLPAAAETSSADDRAKAAPARSISSLLAGIGLLMPAALAYDLP